MLCVSVCVYLCASVHSWEGAKPCRGRKNATFTKEGKKRASESALLSETLQRGRCEKTKEITNFVSFGGNELLNLETLQ